MAKAYWVATYRSISNPDALAGYAKLAGPAIQAAGGRFLARGTAAKAYEKGRKERVVLVEFDSVEQAAAAHDSAAYQAALKALGNAVERDLRIVPGRFYAQRAFPNRFTPPGALKREIAQARALRAASRAAASDSPALAVPALAWSSIGPVVNSSNCAWRTDSSSTARMKPSSACWSLVTTRATWALTASLAGSRSDIEQGTQRTISTCLGSRLAALAPASIRSLAKRM